MSKDTMYRQVELEKPSENGVVSRTFWTDEKYATEGREVKIQEDNGDWDQGWIVKKVYSQTITEKVMTTMRHAHTKQRKASDI